MVEALDVRQYARISETEHLTRKPATWSEKAIHRIKEVNERPQSGFEFWRVDAVLDDAAPLRSLGRVRNGRDGGLPLGFRPAQDHLPGPIA